MGTFALCPFSLGVDFHEDLVRRNLSDSEPHVFISHLMVY
jgi:hypothetical protein